MQFVLTLAADAACGRRFGGKALRRDRRATLDAFCEMSAVQSLQGQVDVAQLAQVTLHTGLDHLLAGAPLGQVGPPGGRGRVERVFAFAHFIAQGLLTLQQACSELIDGKWVHGMQPG